MVPGGSSPAGPGTGRVQVDQECRKAAFWPRTSAGNTGAGSIDRAELLAGGDPSGPPPKAASAMARTWDGGGPRQQQSPTLVHRRASAGLRRGKTAPISKRRQVAEGVERDGEGRSPTVPAPTSRVSFGSGRAAVSVRYGTGWTATAQTRPSGIAAIQRQKHRSAGRGRSQFRPTTWRGP